jgi:hypothetical protein
MVSVSLPPKRSLDGAPGWPGTAIRETHPILDSAGSEARAGFEAPSQRRDVRHPGTIMGA